MSKEFKSSGDNLTKDKLYNLLINTPKQMQQPNNQALIKPYSLKQFEGEGDNSVIQVRSGTKNEGNYTYTRQAEIYTIELTPFSLELRRIEIVILRGMPKLILLGCSNHYGNDLCVKVNTALKNSGFKLPPSKIIVNLTSITSRQSLRGLALPIAMGILAATKQIRATNDVLAYGDLSLKGTVISNRQDLALAVLDINELKQKGIDTVFLPAEVVMKQTLFNREQGQNAISLKNIAKTKWVAYTARPTKYQQIENNLELKSESRNNHVLGIHERKNNLATHDDKSGINSEPAKDFVVNKLMDFTIYPEQALAFQALQYAVSGQHNMLMIGSPGCGKTTLANLSAAMMPPLEKNARKRKWLLDYLSAADEVKLDADWQQNMKPDSLLDNQSWQPPFQQPSFKLKVRELFINNLQPGSLLLSENGILYLDELPQFSNDVLLVLKDILTRENLEFTYQRQLIDYQPKSLIIASMNPCPCGDLLSKAHKCQCRPYLIDSYWRRLDQALMDRFDITAILHQIPKDELTALESAKSLKTNINQLCHQIAATQNIQRQRFQDLGIEGQFNRDISPDNLSEFMLWDQQTKDLSLDLANKLQLSARSYLSLCQLARTIADFSGLIKVGKEAILMASQFRRGRYGR